MKLESFQSNFQRCYQITKAQTLLLEKKTKIIKMYCKLLG